MLPVLVLFAATIATAPGPADLEFMTGAWLCGNHEITLEERWTEEAGGLMLGVGRTIKAGRAVAFEYLRLEFRQDGIVYVAQPGGGPGTEFRLTAADGTSATFENPGHDHPNLIRYALNPDGTLAVEIRGVEGTQAWTFEPTVAVRSGAEESHGKATDAGAAPHRTRGR